MSKKKRKAEKITGSLTENMLMQGLMQAFQPYKPETGFIDTIFERMTDHRTRWSQRFISKAHMCNTDCNLRQGIAVAIPDRAKLAEDLSGSALDQASNCVVLVSVEEHTRDYSVVMLDVETAKKFVNAVGTAISMIESPSEVQQ